MLLKSRIAGNYLGEAKPDDNHNWVNVATVGLASDTLIDGLHADCKDVLSLWKFKQLSTCHMEVHYNTISE